MSDDITMGELARRMEVLHKDLREMRTSLISRDDLSNTHTQFMAMVAAHESNDLLRFAGMQKDIDSLQSWQTWAMRVVLGAVLLGLLGLLASQGGAV